MNSSRGYNRLMKGSGYNTSKMRLRDLILLLRPKQWTKNLLVFAAILFTNNLSNLSLMTKVCEAFVAMCLLSIATYLANDLLDIERDRLHPKKKNRPLASGAIRPLIAQILCPVALICGLFLVWQLGTLAFGIGIAYLLLQTAYNLWFKRVPVTDVFILSLGFVLRAALGAAAIDVKISGWLLFCTGALALLLGFGKRRHELTLQVAGTRESLAGYTEATLNALVLIAASSASLCYGVYSIESPTAKKYPGMILTALFVFYGVARYIYLLFKEGETGEPESILLTDPHIIASVVLFILTSVLAISGIPLPLVD